jgi:hypothetical protein
MSIGFLKGMAREMRHQRAYCRMVGREGEEAKLYLPSAHDLPGDREFRFGYRTWRQAVWDRAIRIKQNRKHRQEHLRRFGQGVDPR